MGLIPQRLYSGSLLLAGPGAIAYINGSAKAGYCSCIAEIWAAQQVACRRDSCNHDEDHRRPPHAG